MRKLLFFIPFWLWISAAHAAIISGTVLDDRGQALPYANISVEGTTLGAVSGDGGNFSLPDLEPGAWSLRVSLLGFESQTIKTELGADTLKLTVRLAESPIEMEGVDVTTERLPTGVETSLAVRTEIISGEDLQERATGNNVITALGSETGLKTRPCAMCGSCGIGMQGLDPSYTEVSVDGMPVFSGLGSLYGLDGLTAADVSRVELTKGSGNNEAGSAAVAGAMNLVSVKPSDSLLLRLSTDVNQYGRNSIAASAGGQLFGLPSRLSLSHQAEPDRIDSDDDGVTDVPKFNRTNLQWNVSLPVAAGGDVAVASRVFYEHRFAGELNWSRGDRGSADVYARDIYTRRYEATAGYTSRPAPTRFSLDGAWVSHEQDSWYGTTEFDALQRMSLVKATVDHAWSQRHATTAQVTHNYQDYRDNLRLNAPTDLRLSVPGMMLQQVWTPREHWAIQAGARAEYYPDDKFVLVPRGSVRWAPASGTVVRFSAGTGYRPVTIFSLDEAVMMGFENVTLDENLRAERSTSYTLNLNRTWTGRSIAANVDVNAFYTHFAHKAVVAFGTHNQETIYTNADNAYSRGVELQARVQEGRGWSLKGGLARSEVRYEKDGRWKYGELQHIFSADGRIGKAWKAAGVKSEVSADVIGPQYLPEGRSRLKSPTYALWNAMVAKTWKQVEVSLSVRNIFDWTQSDRPFPRDPQTGRLLPDTALMYGPLVGRTVHVGMSYSL